VERTSTITNLKKSSLFVKKSKGNYHEIYNSANLLNTNIVRDMPDLFSGFMIDLRDIKTETKMPESKSDVIRLFENYLNLENEAEQQLKDSVNPSINSQYKQGI
jgi:putative protease